MNCTDYASDQEYVRDIRTGGQAQDRAIECLYRRYRPDVLNMVRSYLRFRSGIQDDAADMVQDAYLILIEKIRDGGYNQGSLVHFWTGITKGLLRNKLKRDARTNLTDDNNQFEETDVATPEFLLLNAEEKSRLERILDQLGPKCKQVLMLWAGGYSMEEIATEMELSSEAMARKTKYRCKNQLMELIGSIQTDL